MNESQVEFKFKKSFVYVRMFSNFDSNSFDSICKFLKSIKIDELTVKCHLYCKAEARIMKYNLKQGIITKYRIRNCLRLTPFSKLPAHVYILIDISLKNFVNKLISLSVMRLL